MTTNAQAGVLIKGANNVLRDSTIGWGNASCAYVEGEDHLIENNIIHDAIQLGTSIYGGRAGKTREGMSKLV